MDKNTADKMAERIYNTLTSERFARWHDGRLFNHITDEAGTGATKEQIMGDIKQLFHLE